MTDIEVENILAKGEGVRLEFKQSLNGDVPKTIYETVCSFLNREGGTILVGVDDNGEVTGIPETEISNFITTFSTTVNNISTIDPPMLVSPSSYKFKDKSIIVIKLPVSSQVHKYRNIIYDRIDEGDVKIVDDTKINEIYFRKRQVFTEGEIYKHLSLEDLDPKLFDKAREIIRVSNPSHPLLELSNMDILRATSLHRKDFKTGEEGFTLASALIFGKKETIQSMLPAYKVEAIVRKHNLDRWDDRITLRTNLIDTYLSLMEFIGKHLEDKFYLNEQGQRINLRQLIFREVIGNVIVHREYTNQTSTEILIKEDKVVATNPNKVSFKGMLDIQNFSPFAKNPNLRKFFTAFGWTDEIGSGVRNITKYLAQYTKGAIPVFMEDDIFTTEIPLIQRDLSPFSEYLLSLLSINDSLDLTKIFVSTDVEGTEVQDFIYNLLLRWNEEGIKMQNIDWVNKGLSLKDWYEIELWEGKSQLIQKRNIYLLQILFYCLEALPLDEVLSKIGYSNKQSFRERYLSPLLKEGLLERTMPDKPNSKYQRYRISNKGLLFLGGFKIM